MTKPEWLVEIEEVLPEIQAVAEGCDERFQQMCFEQLLVHALESARSTGGNGGESVDGPQRYRTFLEQEEINEAALGNLVDFESGEILARNLGRTRAEIQRRIAALTALVQCAQEGEFLIPLDQLVSHCETFDAMDDNLTRNLRNTTVDSSRVFIQVGDDWRLSAPGESFLAEVIAELSQ